MALDDLSADWKNLRSVFADGFLCFVTPSPARWRHEAPLV